MEGSIARARVGAHWPLENLIIEKSGIVVTLTLDGETQIHDVMPTQHSEMNQKEWRRNARILPTQRV